MPQTVTMTSEMAAIFAAAITPDIHAYIDVHRKEYEEFLERWNERQVGEAVNE